MSVFDDFLAAGNTPPSSRGGFMPSWSPAEGSVIGSANRMGVSGIVGPGGIIRTPGRPQGSNWQVMPDGSVRNNRLGPPPSSMPTGPRRVRGLMQRSLNLGRAGRGGGLGGMLLPALARDVGEMQGAADDQFNRNEGRIDALSQFLGGLQGMLVDPATGVSARAQGDARGLQQLGDQQTADFLAMGEEAVGPMREAAAAAGRGADRVGDIAEGVVSRGRDVEGMVREGLGLGGRAIGTMAGAVAGYADRTAQDASAVAAGIWRQAESQIKQIRAGLLPDGSPMTPEMQADAMRQIQYDTGTQVQQAVTGMMSDFNRTKAELGMQLAEMERSVGDMNLQGAQILNQTSQSDLSAGGLALEAEGLRLRGFEGLSAAMFQKVQGLLQTQEGVRQLAQLAQSSREFGYQVEEAARLNTANLMASGLSAVADLTNRNPRTVVSWFQGLLTLLSAQAASTGRPVSL